MKLFLNLSFLLFTTCISTPAFSDESHAYDTQILDNTLDSPWAVVTSPNGNLFVTDKIGEIYIYKNGKRIAKLQGLPTTIADIGQGGLLDLAFHPQFDKNKFIYLSYSTEENAFPLDGINTRISRFKLNNNKLTEEKVLVQGGYGDDGAHFGSRLVFDEQGKLYATFGERHNKEKAQDLAYLNGKVIRINDDGSIPEDNPYFLDPTARKEIFTLGHRNPQGLDIHPISNALVISEHGPSGYDASLPGMPQVGKADEINVLAKGANFGWPMIFGTPEVLPWTDAMKSLVIQKNLQMPLREYSIPDAIAPSGVAFYTGNKFPLWKNNLFVAALRGYLLRVVIDENNQFVTEEKIKSESFSRARDVTTGADGNIYVVTGMGELIRMSPKAP